MTDITQASLIQGQTAPTDITASPFNQGEPHNQPKGKKGFQPKEVRADVKMTFRVTKAQAEAIRNECKERGVTISQLVRAGIACYVLPPAKDGYINIDEDQLSFWD